MSSEIILPAPNVVAVTGAHTQANAETTLAAGTFTVTGPPSVLNNRAKVVNSGTGTITWAAASGTVENAPTGAAASFTITPGDAYSLVCDGTNWWIV